MKKILSACTAIILSYMSLTAGNTPSAHSPDTTFNHTEVNLADTLEGVTVRAEKNRIIYKLGMRQISGTSSLSASGGTAADILKSTPSIRIDADGEISFRGSTGFLVYVDGKPAITEGTQALEQIPASSIEDIEIITTPSAKYKTDGDAGIINIKTKKLLDEGLSGNFSLNGSTIGAWGVDALLSYRKDRSRWYAGGTFSDVRRESDFEQLKTTIVDDYVTTSDADGVRFGDFRTYVGKVGWEYDDLTRNRLLVEFQGGVTENARGGDMSYFEERTIGSAAPVANNFNSHDRYSNEKRLAQIRAEYELLLNDKGDKLTVDGRMRHDWYALEYTESNMFDLSGNRYEGTRGYEDEYHWDSDFSAVLEKGLGAVGNLETGYQFSSYSEIGDYSIKYWDRGLSDFEWQDDLYADFYYRRQIHSLFAMLSGRTGKFTYDAGLRGDWNLDKMNITVAGASRNIKRLNFFPSAHLSYNLTDRDIFSMGYSYRVNRHGIHQLEPYITYEDYYTKKIGNPDIRPEYIHSAEASYRKIFNGGSSLMVGGFYRARKDVLDRIRVAYEPGVTLDSLINAGNDISAGLEMSAVVKATRWWNINANGSLFKYRFSSFYEGCEDSANTSYQFALINDFSLGKSTKVQFDSNFIGPTVLTQGREDAYFYFDLSLRKQFLGNRLSASVVAHDLFRTARYHNIRKTATLISETFVRPRFPNIMLTLSYSFNSSGHKEQKKDNTAGSIFEGKDF